MVARRVGRLRSRQLRILLLVPFVAVAIVSAWVFSPAVLAAPGEAPEWRVGETWTYRGYLTAPGPPDNFTTTITVLEMDSGSALLGTWDTS